jgi:transposase
VAKKRSSYTPEFRREAVRLVVEQGLTAAKVAEDLGVSRNTMYTWVQELREEIEAKGHGVQRSESEELRRLRKEVQELRMERDILKKAAAYFAKESK